MADPQRQDVDHALLALLEANAPPAADQGGRPFVTEVEDHDAVSARLLLLLSHLTWLAAGLPRRLLSAVLGRP